MTRPEISALLAQLRAELASHPEVDEGTRASLGALGQDIQRVLASDPGMPSEAPEDASIGAPDMAYDEPDINVLAQTLEAKLEAGHPYLVSTLRDLMDRLGKMGI